MSFRKGWKYYTYVKPDDDRINDPLVKAFNLFLKEVIIEKDSLLKYLDVSDDNGMKINKNKRIIINTAGINNNIKIQNQFNGEHIFFKNRFLANKKFKQHIIDYYNSVGIFVKGPFEIIKRDGTTSDQWVVELSKIHSNNG